MGRGTQATPIKLPKAPPQYSMEDQDRTRRLIEQVLAMTGLSIQFLNTPTAAGDVEFIPISPIHGTVTATGLASPATSAFIQILNPASANKLMVVYRLAFNYTSALTPATVRWQIVDTPSSVTVQNTAGLQHMDETDVTAITSSMVGGTLGSAAAEFTNFGSPMMYSVRANSSSSIVRAFQMEAIHGDMPLILLPGQALEGVNDRDTSDSVMQAYVQFDEVPLTTVLGSTPTDGFPHVRSSIVAGVSTSKLGTYAPVSGQLSLLQLYNPGPNLIKVTGLYVLGNPSLNKVGLRRTSTPLVSAGGQLFTMATRRMDRRSTVAVTGRLLLGNNWGTTIFGGPFIWQDGGVTGGATNLPWHARIVRPLDFPIIIKPGSALEYGGLSDSSAIGGYPLACLIFWDEVAP